MRKLKVKRRLFLSSTPYSVKFGRGGETIDHLITGEECGFVKVTDLRQEPINEFEEGSKHAL
jgi:hypothetical protein